MAQRLFRQGHLQPVRNGIEPLHGDSARRGHRFGKGLPKRIDHLLHLAAVGIRHLVEDERLDGALVFAGRRTEHLGFHSQLVEQSFVEHGIPGKAVPHQPAVGLQVDAVGSRCEVIATLAVGFVVGDHEFAALLERFDGGTQLLQTRHRDRAAAVRMQADPGDPAVARCGVNGRERLVERDAPILLDHLEKIIRERIGLRRIRYRLRKVDPENRIGLHGDGRLHRPGDTDQNEDPQKQHHKAAHHKSQEPRQKHL